MFQSSFVLSDFHYKLASCQLPCSLIELQTGQDIGFVRIDCTSIVAAIRTQAQLDVCPDLGGRQVSQ